MYSSKSANNFLNTLFAIFLVKLWHKQQEFANGGLNIQQITKKLFIVAGHKIAAIPLRDTALHDVQKA